MGQFWSQERRRGSAAAAAVLILALTACTSPAPPAASSPATSSPATSSQSPSSPGASAAPETSPATGSASPGAGGLGGFGTVTEACAAVSATVLSVLVLPMAAATGQDTADVEKAKEAIEKMQGQVPAELKESFDKLKSIADDAGQDFSRFNSEDFDKTIAPIDAWLQANC